MKNGTLYTLATDQWLERPIDEVFAFFADAMNLEAITPPWLRFSILTPPPIDMRVGRLIDYKLRLRGIPIRWQSEITAWEPPHRFVDEQRRGPYRIWIHEHTFAPDRGGTRVRDRVQYAVPGGALVRRFLVAPQLREIFDYRARRIAELLAPCKVEPSP
ncbi:MAG: CDP-paratose 2-epimerase [Planctomycetota bacterium]|nr:MAG: CDP-paratose 2-epimerase [Planctomycetota bacterium]